MEGRQVARSLVCRLAALPRRHGFPVELQDHGQHRAARFLAVHRIADGPFQRIGRAEQQLEQRRRDRPLTAAQHVEQALKPVRQVGDRGVTHGRGHAFKRMRGAEYFVKQIPG